MPWVVPLAVQHATSGFLKKERVGNKNYTEITMSLGGIDNTTSKAQFTKQQAADIKPKKGPGEDPAAESVMESTELAPKDLMKTEETNGLQPSRKLDTKA